MTKLTHLAGRKSSSTLSIPSNRLDFQSAIDLLLGVETKNRPKMSGEQSSDPTKRTKDDAIDLNKKKNVALSSTGGSHPREPPLQPGQDSLNPLMIIIPTRPSSFIDPTRVTQPIGQSQRESSGARPNYRSSCRSSQVTGRPSLRLPTRSSTSASSLTAPLNEHAWSSIRLGKNATQQLAVDHRGSVVAPRLPAIDATQDEDVKTLAINELNQRLKELWLLAIDNEKSMKRPHYLRFSFVCCQALNVRSERTFLSTKEDWLSDTGDSDSMSFDAFRLGVISMSTLYTQSRNPQDQVGFIDKLHTLMAECVENPSHAVKEYQMIIDCENGISPRERGGRAVDWRIYHRQKPDPKPLKLTEMAEVNRYGSGAMKNLTAFNSTAHFKMSGNKPRDCDIELSKSMDKTLYKTLYMKQLFEYGTSFQGFFGWRDSRKLRVLLKREGFVLPHGSPKLTTRHILEFTAKNFHPMFEHMTSHMQLQFKTAFTFAELDYEAIQPKSQRPKESVLSIKEGELQPPTSTLTTPATATPTPPIPRHHLRRPDLPMRSALLKV